MTASPPRTSSGVPSAMVRPSASTWMRSQSRMIRRRSWSTITMPQPSLRSRRAGSLGEQIIGLRLVHACRRLVEQEEARPAGERAGDLDAALLPVGERRRASIGPAVKPVRWIAAARRSARRRGAQAAPTLDVLLDGHPGEQADLLERAPDTEASDACGGRPSRPLSATKIRPPTRPQMTPLTDVQQRRLAAAVRPDQADDLARGRMQRDAVERSHTAELAGEIVNAERMVGRGGDGGHAAQSVSGGAQARTLCGSAAIEEDAWRA